MAEDNPKQPTEAEEADITAAVAAAMAAADGDGEEPIEASTESAMRYLRTSKPNWRRRKMPRSERRQTP